MNPTDLNLFFLWGMLQPVGPLEWRKYARRQSLAASYQKHREKRLAYTRLWQSKNPEKVRAARVRSNKLNREQLNADSRARYAKNPDIPREYARRYRGEHKEKCNAAGRAWRRENPEKQAAANKTWNLANPGYRRAREAVDPRLRILRVLRSRVYHALRGGTKSARTLELLGTGISEYRAHLQAQFQPGMTWKNYGSVWHVDHIRPCASFDLTNPAQQRECFHYSNCQPLFAADNLRKGANFQN